jgi:hypothetical protein
MGGSAKRVNLVAYGHTSTCIYVITFWLTHHSVYSAILVPRRQNTHNCVLFPHVHSLNLPTFHTMCPGVGTDGQLTFAGVTERIHIMARSALPVEIQELILAKVPLVALARSSTTCQAWYAFSSSRLAQGQRTLALEVFGRQRIGGIAVTMFLVLRGQIANAHPHRFQLHKGYNG